MLGGEATNTNFTVFGVHIFKETLKGSRKCFECIKLNIFNNSFHTVLFNCLDGAMVSVLASSVVDRVFEPRWGQTKDCKIKIWTGIPLIYT
jgi:hypothetical protein